MYKTNGLFKNVYVYDKWVIKLPRFFNRDCLARVYAEHFNYIITKPKVKKYLLRIWFIPFIPITFQRKVKVIRKQRQVDFFVRTLHNDKISIYENEVLQDLKCDNLGMYKGKIVKIDFDATYVLHNIKVDIKLFIKKLKKEIR